MFKKLFASIRQKLFPPPEKVPVINDQTTELWPFLWQRIKPYRWMLVIVILLNCFHGFSVSFQTLMTKYLIDDIILIKEISINQRIHRLILIVIAYLLISNVGRMLFWHLSYRILTRIRERVLFSLRIRFFWHVNQLCVRFHKSHNSGELFNYLFGSPLANIQNFFNQFTMSVPGALFTLITTILWVGLWSWQMTLVLCIAVLSTTVIMNFSRKTMRQLHTDFQKMEGNISGIISDLLRGSRDVKLFAMEEQVQQDFETHANVIRQKSYERDIKTHMQYMKQESSGYFCFAALCLIGVLLYLKGQLTLGEFQGYLSAYIALQGPMQTLFNIGTSHGSAQAGFGRIMTVLTTSSTTPDPKTGALSVPEKGEITFSNVSFKYEENMVIDKVTFRIPYGQHVALVGPSGSGKSTILQLILRLYDPIEGTVTLDCGDVRSFRGSELRDRFGVVPQDPYIFSTTIRENLRVVNPHASEDEIKHACRLANAWEFIEHIPRQLDATVGEAASQLSGGQKQRLAIARALLANPSYFIFDEATSALDTLSEKLIQDSLERAMAGKTALIIAHRLATVKNCDRILVLEHGRLIQDGAYNDLLNSDGIFARLVKGQELRS